QASTQLWRNTNHTFPLKNIVISRSQGEKVRPGGLQPMLEHEAAYSSAAERV
ncbi:hypothetical protein JMJ77_0007527, partial [Colletotrichum scovillei]